MFWMSHPSASIRADNRRLLDTLASARHSNTILIVEHDEETMRSADHIIDLGPGGGRSGGEIVAAGHNTRCHERSGIHTGKYLTGELRIEYPKERRKGNGKRLIVKGAKHNNLKNLDVEFPLGLFICVTGVSGAGKSSLVDDIVYKVLSRKLHRALTNPGQYREIAGIEHLDKVIEIDQSPIGRTPRSNPATYTGLFAPLRELLQCSRIKNPRL